jgi:hypothetical protein
MKTLQAALFLATCSLGFSQESSDLFEKAPPPIDEALRARVDKFYQSYVTGKFREAFAMVAEDSQDAFFAAPKAQFKKCETIRINWSEQFTKAQVVEGCDGEFRFHGQSIPVKRPVSSDWKLVDGQWYWCYVKPTMLPTPFYPTGAVPIPESTAAPNEGKLPSSDEIRALATHILQMVKVDKTTINLRSDESSKDELHIRNEMPGAISFTVGQVALPGLKITPAKTELQANEETTVLFEYRLDDASIACVDCAKKIQSTVGTGLKIQPTGQFFPIEIVIANPPPQQHIKQ